jgi:hypothetical protein
MENGRPRVFKEDTVILSFGEYQPYLTTSRSPFGKSVLDGESLLQCGHLVRLRDRATR